MENLQEIVLKQVMLSGACAAGIATTETLAGGPESADIGKLLRMKVKDKIKLSGLRSFRVSRFWIIYRVVKKEVEIVAVSFRIRIYEKTYWLLQKNIS